MRVELREGGGRGDLDRDASGWQDVGLGAGPPRGKLGNSGRGGGVMGKGGRGRSSPAARGWGRKNPSSPLDPK